MDQPGTGKSSLAYRLAVSLGRHLIAIDLKSILQHCEKHQVHGLLFNPFLNGIPVELKEVIILIEEIDTAVEYLLERKHFANRTHEEKIIVVGEGKHMNPTNPRNRVDLEDLLDILQGPFQAPGSILIATTNKYESMVKLCPALFRPGRLSPIKIDYMDWQSLQAFSEHCFGECIDIACVPDTSLISSEIIEHAQICLVDGGFSRFQLFIKNKLNIR